MALLVNLQECSRILFWRLLEGKEGNHQEPQGLASLCVNAQHLDCETKTSNFSQFLPIANQLLADFKETHESLPKSGLENLHLTTLF